MPRTLVDIPADIIKKLDYIAAEKHISRSELVRMALKELIESNKKEINVFGILKNKIDSIEFQIKLRDEW